MKHSALIAIFIASLLAASVTDAAPDHTKGRAVKPFTSELKSGDYIWHPEVSPAGPVVVFVSLPDQVVYVYRNGVRIGRSTVSTGKPGKPTPTGVFTVLQKKVHHESSIYKGQRGEDAPHAAADVDRPRATRGALAGLSGFGGVRAAAGGFRVESLHGHDSRLDG